MFELEMGSYKVVKFSSHLLRVKSNTSLPSDSHIGFPFVSVDWDQLVGQKSKQVLAPTCLKNPGLQTLHDLLESSPMKSIPLSHDASVGVHESDASLKQYPMLHSHSRFAFLPALVIQRSHSAPESKLRQAWQNREAQRLQSSGRTQPLSIEQSLEGSASFLSHSYDESLSSSDAQSRLTVHKHIAFVAGQIDQSPVHDVVNQSCHVTS